MKFSSALLPSLVLARSTIAAPTLQPAGSAQPQSIYPIGTGGSFAKPAGRLFNLAGKVEYFAGSNAWWLAHLLNNADVDLVLSEVANVGFEQ